MDMKKLRELVADATPVDGFINRHMQVTVQLEDFIALLDEVDRLRGHNALAQDLEVRRVQVLERTNDRLFAWRNWSDGVAPPFGADRDRSDDGQRKAIKKRLAAVTAALNEACDLADSALTNLSEVYPHHDDGMRSNIYHADKRITELRKVGQ